MTSTSRNFTLLVIADQSTTIEGAKVAVSDSTSTSKSHVIGSSPATPGTPDSPNLTIFIVTAEGQNGSNGSSSYGRWLSDQLSVSASTPNCSLQTFHNSTVSSVEVSKANSGDISYSTVISGPSSTLNAHFVGGHQSAEGKLMVHADAVLFLGTEVNNHLHSKEESLLLRSDAQEEYNVQYLKPTLRATTSPQQVRALIAKHFKADGGSSGADHSPFHPVIDWLLSAESTGHNSAAQSNALGVAASTVTTARGDGLNSKPGGNSVAPHHGPIPFRRSHLKSLEGTIKAQVNRRRSAAIAGLMALAAGGSGGGTGVINEAQLHLEIQDVSGGTGPVSNISGDQIMNFLYPQQTDRKNMNRPESEEEDEDEEDDIEYFRPVTIEVAVPSCRDESDVSTLFPSTKIQRLSTSAGKEPLKTDDDMQEPNLLTSFLRIVKAEVSRIVSTHIVSIEGDSEGEVLLSVVLDSVTNQQSTQVASAKAVSDEVIKEGVRNTIEEQKGLAADEIFASLLKEFSKKEKAQGGGQVDDMLSASSPSSSHSIALQLLQRCLDYSATPAMSHLDLSISGPQQDTAASAASLVPMETLATILTTAMLKALAIHPASAIVEGRTDVFAVVLRSLETLSVSGYSKAYAARRQQFLAQQEQNAKDALLLADEEGSLLQNAGVSNSASGSRHKRYYYDENGEEHTDEEGDEDDENGGISEGVTPRAGIEAEEAEQARIKAEMSLAQAENESSTDTSDDAVVESLALLALESIKAPHSPTNTLLSSARVSAEKIIHQRIKAVLGSISFLTLQCRVLTDSLGALLAGGQSFVAEGSKKRPVRITSAILESEETLTLSPLSVVLPPAVQAHGQKGTAASSSALASYVLSNLKSLTCNECPDFDLGNVFKAIATQWEQTANSNNATAQETYGPIPRLPSALTSPHHSCPSLTTLSLRQCRIPLRHLCHLLAQCSSLRSIDVSYPLVPATSAPSVLWGGISEVSSMTSSPTASRVATADTLKGTRNGGRVSSFSSSPSSRHVNSRRNLLQNLPPYWLDPRNPTHGALLLRATRRFCTSVTMRGAGLADALTAEVLFEIACGVDTNAGVVSSEFTQRVGFVYGELIDNAHRELLSASGIPLGDQCAIKSTSSHVSEFLIPYGGYLPSRLAHLDLGDNSLGCYTARLIGQLACGVVDKRSAKLVASSASGTAMGFAPHPHESQLHATLFPFLKHLDLSNNSKMDHAALVYLLRTLGKGASAAPAAATLPTSDNVASIKAIQVPPIEAFLLHQHVAATTHQPTQPSIANKSPINRPLTSDQPKSPLTTTPAASQSSLEPFITVTDLPDLLAYLLHRDKAYSSAVSQALVGRLVVGGDCAITNGSSAKRARRPVDAAVMVAAVAEAPLNPLKRVSLTVVAPPKPYSADPTDAPTADDAFRPPTREVPSTSSNNGRPPPPRASTSNGRTVTPPFGKRRSNRSTIGANSNANEAALLSATKNSEAREATLVAESISTLLAKMCLPFNSEAALERLQNVLDAGQPASAATSGIAASRLFTALSSASSLSTSLLAQQQAANKVAATTGMLPLNLTAIEIFENTVQSQPTTASPANLLATNGSPSPVELPDKLSVFLSANRAQQTPPLVGTPQNCYYLRQAVSLSESIEQRRRHAESNELSIPNNGRYKPVSCLLRVHDLQFTSFLKGLRWLLLERGLLTGNEGAVTNNKKSRAETPSESDRKAASQSRFIRLADLLEVWRFDTISSYFLLGAASAYNIAGCEVQVVRSPHNHIYSVTNGATKLLYLPTARAAVAPYVLSASALQEANMTSATSDEAAANHKTVNQSRGRNSSAVSLIEAMEVERFVRQAEIVFTDAVVHLRKANESEAFSMLPRSDGDPNFQPNVLPLCGPSASSRNVGGNVLEGVLGAYWVTKGLSMMEE